MVEMFDADLALCATVDDGVLSVKGVEGFLSRDGQPEGLPYQTLKQTLNTGEGVRMLERLESGNGPQSNVVSLHGSVSTMSYFCQETSTIFVAARLLSKGRYKNQDLIALQMLLTSLEEATV